MVMQREYTGVYPGSGKRRPYVQQGAVLYFLAPKCLRRGYKLLEREPILGLRERESTKEIA
jgi:ribosomal protein L24E